MWTNPWEMAQETLSDTGVSSLWLPFKVFLGVPHWLLLANLTLAPYPCRDCPSVYQNPLSYFALELLKQSAIFKIVLKIFFKNQNNLQKYTQFRNSHISGIHNLEPRSFSKNMKSFAISQVPIILTVITGTLCRTSLNPVNDWTLLGSHLVVTYLLEPVFPHYKKWHLKNHPAPSPSSQACYPHAMEHGSLHRTIMPFLYSLFSEMVLQVLFSWL